jgi:hypothetical protein
MTEKEIKKLAEFIFKVCEGMRIPARPKADWFEFNMKTRAKKNPYRVNDGVDSNDFERALNYLLQNGYIKICFREKTKSFYLRFRTKEEY